MLTRIRTGFAVALLSAVCVFSADDGTIMLNGSIKTMVGQVEVNSGTGKWRAARAGMMVKMGWDVRTYIESSADIEFPTGTVLRIGENSVVTLSKMMLDKRADVTSSTIKVATGKVWANVKKLANSKSSFEFETPTAVASIRGTRLGIAVDKQGTQIDVYEGLVMVKPRGAGKEVAVSTRNRAEIRTDTKVIRLINFAAEKDSIKGMPPMKDPFRDSTGTQKMDALLDSTKFAAAADSSLRLEVLSPAAGASVKETPVLVKGKASRDAAVDIGGREVVLEKDGSFSMLVDLGLGKNAVPVTARRAGSAKTVEMAVEYHPTLTLNVTNVIDNMEVTSSEITVDVEVTEGAKFSVNGKEGQTKVALVAGKNTVSVRAWDQWNTVMEKTFVVNYTKTGAFTLLITTPKDQSVVREPMIPVSGSTKPGAKVTVNGTPVQVSAGGFFTYSVPIPDEEQEYSVRVTSRLGDDEVTEERLVTYSPPRPPLVLTVTVPVEGQVIKQGLLRVMGKTNPRAKVLVNSRQANVSTIGVFTCDLQFTEKDIGDYIVEIVANDDSADLMKSINTVVDASSPQINTSVPTLNVAVQGSQVTTQATRNSKVLINISDRTPEDQITVVIQNNGGREELLLEGNGQGYFELEEGKNTFTVQAKDKAGNVAPQVQGTQYYLPGPIKIDIVEPSGGGMLTVDDLPPMPRNPQNPGSAIQPTILVSVELDDGIRSVPETIKWVRVTDNSGRTFQLLDRKNYRYDKTVPLIRGQNIFTVHVEDVAGNIGTERFEVNIR